VAESHRSRTAVARGGGSTKPDPLPGLQTSHRIVAETLAAVERFDEADVHIQKALVWQQQVSAGSAVNNLAYMNTLIHFADYYTVIGPEGAVQLYRQCVEAVQKYHRGLEGIDTADRLTRVERLCPPSPLTAVAPSMAAQWEKRRHDRNRCSYAYDTTQMAGSSAEGWRRL
jgi:hypothetical protein